jgi:excisionase family DNA binding protein
VTTANIKERITVSKAALLLGVSPQTVRSLIRKHQLIALRVGGKFLIEASEIERFIAENTNQ